MKSTVLIAAIALLTGTVGASLFAADRDHAASAAAADGYDHGMQVVANAARPGEAAYGWRYYCDPATHRAVVISPQGDYYLSRGEGLRWVVKTQVAA